MVLRDNAPEILLGRDYPLTRSLLAGRKPKIYDPTPCKVKTLNRAQSKTQEREQVDNIAACTRNGAVSKQVKSAAPTSSPPTGKGKIHKQSLPLVVASQLEGTIPDSAENTPL